MKPKQIEGNEWLYMGCFIQKNSHPNLLGNFQVFKNNKEQTNIGRTFTFSEAKKLCEQNECFENELKF